MALKRILLAAVAIGASLATNVPASAQNAVQTRCLTYVCGQQAHQSQATETTVSGGYAYRVPSTEVGRAAADMSEEGESWQQRNAAGIGEGSSFITEERVHRSQTRQRSTRRTHAAPARSQGATRQHRTRTRAAAPQRRTHASARRPVSRQHVTQSTSSYRTYENYNLVIDRASMYQSSSVGQTSYVTSWTGRGESWSSGTVTRTSWVAPTEWSWHMAPVAGGPPGAMAQQMCGWGHQIDPRAGPSQSFLCHCPAGWRPPGWHHSY
jgi:hypothetical protein